MVTLNNIAKPVFWTLTSRLNATPGVDDIALPTLRTGGGYNYIIINNLTRRIRR